jgi:hypothetical protein
VRVRTILTVLSLIPLTVASGCYEDLGGNQTQQPAPTAGQNPGPLTSVGQPSGSALGGAKRAAHNVVEQAEQRSREVERQAEDPLNDN